MNRFSDNDDFNANDAKPEAEEQAAMMPLMTGGESAEAGGWSEADSAADGAWGESGGSAGSKMLSQGTILIIAIVLIAAGSLYAMRLAGGGLATDEATQLVEAKVEKYLAKLSNPEAVAENDPLAPGAAGAIVADTDDVLAVFNETVVDRQVPVEYVAKNPFTLRLATDDSAAVEVVDRDTTQRRKKLQADADKLALQTVMGGGRVPVAVISGEFYRKGDALGDFIVSTISPETQSVTLTAEGHAFELTMVD